MENNVTESKLNEIINLLKSQHKENFNWAKAIHNEQQNIKKSLGVNDANMPWEPYYNRNVQMSSEEPEIYNKYGERLNVYFLSDREFSNMSVGGGRYIFWDRYNFGLKTHFYSHDEAFRTVGKPDKRFAFLVEPPSIKPQSYSNYKNNKSYIEKNFDAVFTFDDELLNNLSNAKFAPLSASIWYGRKAPKIDRNTTDNGDILSAANYKNKTKNISIIASNKRMCQMHLVRQALAMKCKNENLADTYGKFDGGEYVPIELPFQYYRYSIAVENMISPYYFTEKIINCFAAQTIPIYLGATKIDEFFNPDGIIKLKLEDVNNIGEILKQCTKEEYERRLPAIIDNYNRAINDYQNSWDFIYKKYF